MEELHPPPEPAGPKQEENEPTAEVLVVSVQTDAPMDPPEVLPEAITEPESTEQGQSSIGTPVSDVSPDCGAVELPVSPQTDEQPAAVQESPNDVAGAMGMDESSAELASPEIQTESSTGSPADAVSMDELMGTQAVDAEVVPEAVPVEDAQLKAVLEAIVYVAEEPFTVTQLSAALGEPAERIRWLLAQLVEEYDRPEHGIAIREVAGGFKMTTKPEHHDGVRNFVKSLKPPLKLSLPALETLAVIAYKQPVTAPEIMEIRGVQGAGVIKTLLDRKLIATAGRKNVIGKPILYKTTKEFLIQFGLKDLLELPSLREFEEIRRMAFGDEPVADSPAQETPLENRSLPLVEPDSDSAEN